MNGEFLLVALMTILPTDNDRLDHTQTGEERKREKKKWLPRTESGPSNLCYNPFGSRGDGTFGRHKPEEEEKKKLLFPNTAHTVVGKKDTRHTHTQPSKTTTESVEDEKERK